MGYMLGGLDWTGTALGQAFKSQEQVLFLFAGIIFIISVTLHMFSIPERPFTPCNLLKDTGSVDSSSQLSYRPISHPALLLDVIAEEDTSAQAPSQEDRESDLEEGEMDFFAVERVRSKSDSVLAMPDATIELDSDLEPDTQMFLPDERRIHEELEDAFKPSDDSFGSTSSPGGPHPRTDGMPINPVFPEQKDPTNGRPPLLQISSGSDGSNLRQVK